MSEDWFRIFRDLFPVYPVLSHCPLKNDSQMLHEWVFTYMHHEFKPNVDRIYLIHGANMGVSTISSALARSGEGDDLRFWFAEERIDIRQRV